MAEMPADRPTQWSYEEAFSRNIGWVTEPEQQTLRTKRIAIAGMGGVGGEHLLTLARLGVGRFNISDFDVFEVANFNRQAGATVSHVGQSKVDVMEGMARDINPALDVRRFPDGISPDNLDAFLDGVDVYVDSMDFFAIDVRRRLFAACAERAIPAITAAPLGMGAALLCFLPGGMTFEEYFQVKGHDEPEQLLRFLVGLAPARVHMGYLVVPESIDLPNHRGPSTPIAVHMCASVAAGQVLKVLLPRGRVPAAPWGLQFDAYRNKLTRTWRPGGNAHPIQRLALALGRRKFLAALSA